MTHQPAAGFLNHPKINARAVEQLNVPEALTHEALTHEALTHEALTGGYDLPARHGLYDPRFEHDACGIGFVAHMEGKRSYRVLEMGLEALCNHAHRGAVADDRKTGDGAGILTQLPYEFFNRELRRMGFDAPPASDLAVGQLFLNRQNGEDRAQARADHPQRSQGAQARGADLSLRACD